MNITFVSGANSKYYKCLTGLIKNIKLLKCKENLQNFRFIVYDLGLNGEEKEYLKNDNFIVYEFFDYSKYPDHVSLKKYNGVNCSYAWKPIIFYDVCEKYGGIVQWLDTMTIYTNLQKVINFTMSNGIYTPRSEGSIGKWTHKTCLEYMKVNLNLNLPPRAGGILTINYDIIWCKKLIKEWRDLSLIKECIVPNGSSRDNHRQDQAILSILYYQYLLEYKFKSYDAYVNFHPHKRKI